MGACGARAEPSARTWACCTCALSVSLSQPVSAFAAAFSAAFRVACSCMHVLYAAMTCWHASNLLLGCDIWQLSDLLASCLHLREGKCVRARTSIQRPVSGKRRARHALFSVVFVARAIKARRFVAVTADWWPLGFTRCSALACVIFRFFGHPTVTSTVPNLGWFWQPI